jgi:4-amino-4-deoxy-L-arabinose transferase-like glycosyltransferase
MIYLRTHYRFLAILVIFLALAYLYGSTIPAFEGPDEYRHFAYVTKLAQEGKLPDPVEDVDTIIQQQAGQPPFYYISVALFTQLRRFELWSDVPLNNPQWEQERSNRLNDNLNRSLMSPEINALTAEQKHTADVLNWSRLLSSLYGLLTITGVYWAGLALWPEHKQVALFAALWMALTPQLIQAFTRVSNDVGVITFSTFVIAGALHLYNDWKNPRLIIVTGIAMGLAILSKSSGIVICPIPFTAIFLAWRKENPNERSIRPLLSICLFLGLIAMLFGGWWIVRSWILYNDPLGTNAHTQQDWMYEEPEFHSLTFLRNRYGSAIRDIWVNFGWGRIRPSLWGYAIPIMLVVVGGLIFSRHINRQVLAQNKKQGSKIKTILSIPTLVGKHIFETSRRQTDQRLWLLFLVMMFGIVAFFQWMILSKSTPGRLMYPYYPAVCLLIAWGLQHHPRIRYWFAGALGGLAIILVPTTLYPVFNAPILLDSPPDNLQGEAVVFGQVEFLGYQVEDAQADSGIYDIRLCWQAPDGDEKIAVPYLFSLQLLNEENAIIGERQSYPGMGNYTLWEPSKSFCDVVQISLQENTNESYQLAVNLLDGEHKPVVVGSIPAP